MKEAICHESGHAIVGRALGYTVVKMELRQGFPRTVVDFDSATENSVSKQCVILAAGAAAEITVFGAFDDRACACDQKMIFDRGGEEISTYFPKAQELLKSHHNNFRRLRERLSHEWIEAQSGLLPDSDSFELMDQKEFERFWIGE